MRCDEIRDQIVELLYSEAGTPSASPELRAHVQSCPVCRKELEDLRKVRIALQAWKDEAPIRPVLLPKPAAKPSLFQIRPWRKYAAIAAVVVLAFLAGLYINALFPRPEYYTKEQVRELVKQALDDTEAQISENTNLKLQTVLDYVDHEQGNMYLRLTRNPVDRSRNKN